MFFKLVSIIQFGVIPPICPFRRDGSHITCPTNNIHFVVKLISLNLSAIFILQRHIKYVRNLISVTAYGDHCVLATRADETAGQVVGSVASSAHMNVVGQATSVDMTFELVGHRVAGAVSLASVDTFGC